MIEQLEYFKYATVFGNDLKHREQNMTQQIIKRTHPPT